MTTAENFGGNLCLDKLASSCFFLLLQQSKNYCFFPPAVDATWRLAGGPREIMLLHDWKEDYTRQSHPPVRGAPLGKQRLVI
jgi:hypothetical protein